MTNDLVMMEGKIINICDMERYFYLGNVEKKKELIDGQNLQRTQIRIETNKFLQKLENEGINTYFMEMHLEKFIKFFLEDKRLYNTYKEAGEIDLYNKRKDIFKEHNKLEVWIDTIKNLIDLQVKPENFEPSLAYFDGYVEYILKESKENEAIKCYLSKDKEFKEYLLKKDLDLFYDIENEETIYNIPCFNRHEYLYIILKTYNVKQFVIDVTDRIEFNKSNRIPRLLYLNHTFYFEQFLEKYEKMKNLISCNKTDSIVLELATVYLISMWESYLRSLVKLCLAKGNLYSKIILEKDKDINEKFNFKELKEFFYKFYNKLNEILVAIDNISFQSINKFSLYIEKIFEVYEEEERNELKKSYSDLISQRNLIVHKNGYELDGSRVEFDYDQLNEWYKMIHKVIEEIDNKVYVKVII